MSNNTSVIEKLKGLPDKEKALALAMHIMKVTREERKISTAYLEITPLCNLSCKMCYSRRDLYEAEQEGGILSGKEWIRIAKECINEGALHINLTGGECTLHPDFEQIYRTIYESNAKVCVMTNATNLSKKILDMFCEMPPQLSITVYGFSRETYENACGNPDAYDEVIKNIIRVTELHIPTLLKCTVTNDNIADLPRIYKFAKEHGLEFICANTITRGREACKRDCDSIELDDDIFKDTIRSMYSEDGKKFPNPKPLDYVIDPDKIVKKGMMCGAGRNSLSINWRGEMQPCNTFDGWRMSVRNSSIADVWKKLVEWADNVPQLIECQKCKYSPFCTSCVLFHYNDTHEFGKPSSRLCYKVQKGITD